MSNVKPTDLLTLSREELVTALLRLQNAGVDISSALPSVEPSGETFAVAFGRAFDQLRHQARVNLVPLSSLRSALSGYDTVTFDRELYNLRRANAYVLEGGDGRHGKPSNEVLAGGIRENGRHFLYCSVREG